MLDYILIKLLINKLYYNKYNNIIDLEFYRINNKDLFKLHTVLRQYQETEENPTLDGLELYFHTQYPALSPTDRASFDLLFNRIREIEVDETRALDYLREQRNIKIANDIALKALDVVKGKDTLGTVRELLDEAEIEIVEEKEDDYIVNDDLEYLMNRVVFGDGLMWRQNSMNVSLGPLRKGNFGFLFARPETGKTTFLADQVSYWAEQELVSAEHPILWFNNEEDGGIVVTRIIQSVFGVSTHDLFANWMEYNERYRERIKGKIVFIDNPSMNKKFIEEYCEKFQPSAIIIDQIDKIKWHQSERYDLQMKAIYQWARELAKKYCPTLAVCQAGGTAEGKKYLNMNDVDSSHTAKQGEADFMFGIGKSDNEMEETMRYISICKNKLAGGTMTKDTLRHAKFPLRIIPTTARYEDVVNL